MVRTGSQSEDVGRGARFVKLQSIATKPSGRSGSGRRFCGQASPWARPSGRRSRASRIAGASSASPAGRRGVRGRSAPQPPSADGARPRRSAGTGGRQRFRLRRRLQAFPCGRTIADGVRSTRYIGRAARARDRVLSSALEATLTRDDLAGGVTDADAVVVLLVHEDRGRVLRVIERLGGAPIAIDELRAALETAPHESRRVTPTRPSSRPILERQRAEPLERQRAEPGDASPSPRATGPVARHRSRGHRTFEPSTRSGPSWRWGGDRPRSRHRSRLVS